MRIGRRGMREPVDVMPREEEDADREMGAPGSVPSVNWIFKQMFK